MIYMKRCFLVSQMTQKLTTILKESLVTANFLRIHKFLLVALN